jgi:type VI secretion system protein ImpB
MAESIQHKLDRVRPPRVQITYDVEIGDAIVMKELPFVVGIMADLSGMPDKDLPQRYDPAGHNGDMLDASGAKEPTLLKDRKYIGIDRDNFNDVMKAIAPRLVFTDIPGRKVTGKKVVLDKVTERPAAPPKTVEAGVKDDGVEELKTKWQTEAARNDQNAPVFLQDVGMEFTNIEHFDPFNIIRQIKPLRELYEARSRLSDLLVKLEGNANLDAELRKQIFNKEVMSTQDKLKGIFDATGVKATDELNSIFGDAQPGADGAKGGGAKADDSKKGGTK